MAEFKSTLTNAIPRNRPRQTDDLSEILLFAQREIYDIV